MADDAPLALAALRTELGARDAAAWFSATEAAVYLGLTRSGLRSAVARGLRADGKGARRSALFRRATLDAWLARGAT